MVGVTKASTRALPGAQQTSGSLNLWHLVTVRCYPLPSKETKANPYCPVVYRLLDNGQENPLFRSPIPENATHILDIGCGEGSWPIDVADHHPNSLSLLCPDYVALYYHH